MPNRRLRLIEKPENDLSFVKTKEALPTVEVDLDSIPDTFFGYDSLVANALRPLAKNPAAVATVYVHQGMSVNFHDPTSSAFFAVAGPKIVLNQILQGFQRVPGIRVRFSDYISTSGTRRQFHVQEGEVWRPLDAITWYSAHDDDKEAVTGSEDLGDQDSTHKAEATDNNDSIAGQHPGIARTSVATRFRRARSDASVGGVRRGIEEIFGLPAGSVALCGPDGKPLRSDAKIETLRRRWE